MPADRLSARKQHFLFRHGVKSQDRLMLCMRSLGYKKADGGVCYGYAHMGIQAILAGSVGVRHFNDRLAYIAAIIKEARHEAMAACHDDRKSVSAKTNELISIKINQRVSMAKQKVMENVANQRRWDSRLTKDERVALQLPGFFEGIDLFQHPSSYQEQFSLGEVAAKKCDIKALIQDIYSECVLVRSFSGIYTMQELIVYLESLQSIFSSDNSYPVAVQISSNHHAITVGYHPASKKWIYMDANHLPANTVFTVADIAAKIFNAFSDKNDQPLALALHFWSARTNKTDMLEKLITLVSSESWKKIHDISEKTQCIDSNGNSWFSVAVRIKDIPTATELIEAGADVARPNHKGRSPLRKAKWLGLHKIIKKKQADALPLASYSFLYTRLGDISLTSIPEVGADVSLPVKEETLDHCKQGAIQEVTLESIPVSLTPCCAR